MFWKRYINLTFVDKNKVDSKALLPTLCLRGERRGAEGTHMDRCDYQVLTLSVSLVVLIFSTLYVLV